VIIRDKIYISMDTLGRKATSLCDLFTYSNPEYYIKKQQKLSVAKISPTMCHYKVDVINDERYLVLPRGGFNRVKKFYQDNELPLRVADERLVLPEIDCHLLNTTLEPQQEKIINALMENDGGLIQSDTGCISGDTIINFNRAKKGFKTTIKRAYEGFNQLKYKWDLSKTTYIRSFNGKTIKLHEIEDIVYSGIKEVYKLELENGLTLKCTEDHKIMTDIGYVALNELKNSNCKIMVDTLLPQKSITLFSKPKYKMIGGLIYHPHHRHVKRKGTPSDYRIVEYHRLVYESNMNRIEFDDFIKMLRTDAKKSSVLKYVNPKIFEMHHKDQDPSNNNINNLQKLTISEHKKLHGIINIKNFNQGIPSYSNIKCISYKGTTDTYDIICKDPYRNFVANGIVVHNSGKTISVLGYISRLKQPTLIIVHEHKLRTQWEVEIKNRLSGNFSLGRYDGEVKQDGDICLAVINTAYNYSEGDKSILDKFGLVIVDETHRASSMMFLNILNNSASKYRAGVSATVERKDGNHILIYDLLGDLLVDISAKEVKHRITTFNYEFINTNIKVEVPTRKQWTGFKQEDVMDFSSYVSELIANEQRNDLIIGNVIQDIKDGYYPLVLSTRVKHLDLLHKKLKDCGYNAILLKGAKSKKDRVDWDQVRKDKTVQVIVATDSIAAEGLDLPALSSIHLTLHSSNQPKAKQKIGRIRRELEGKPIPVVRYYVDNEAYLITKNGPSTIFYYSAQKMERYFRQLQRDYEGV